MAMMPPRPDRGEADDSTFTLLVASRRRELADDGEGVRGQVLSLKKTSHSSRRRGRSERLCRGSLRGTTAEPDGATPPPILHHPTYPTSPPHTPPPLPNSPPT